MLALIAVVMVALMGMLVMTLDVGAGHRQRRIAQTAADAGAISGANEIYNLRYGNVGSAAIDGSGRNGYTGTEVVPHYPPVSGPYAGNTQYVEVVIGKRISSIFGSIFGRDSMDVQARAVAGVSSGALNCVFVLNPTGEHTLELNGNLDADQCGVSVNSADPKALYVKAGGDLLAGSVAVSGREDPSSKGSIAEPFSENAPPVPNPLAYLATPTTAGVTVRSTSTLMLNGTDIWLDPGVYVGGISVGTGSGTARLRPGTYFMAGGGLTVQTSGNIFGEGVTIVFTNGPAGEPSTGLTATNSCTATLSAPTGNDPLKGVLFFQDPATSSTIQNTWSCDGTQVGSFYFPTQHLQILQGNGKATIVGSVIAGSLEVKAGSVLTLVSDHSSNSAVKRLSLVE